MDPHSLARETAHHVDCVSRIARWPASCRTVDYSVTGINTGCPLVGPGSAVGSCYVIHQSSVGRSIVMAHAEHGGPPGLTDRTVDRFARVNVTPIQDLRLSHLLGDSTQLRS